MPAARPKAEGEEKVKFYSNSITHGAPIPAEFAFGKIGSQSEPIALSANRNPHFAWSQAPIETQSFALVCIDVDAPSVGDDVNQPGREVPAELARVDFVHWLLIDIPDTCHEIAAGSCADGVTAHGKQHPAGPARSRQGKNDYTSWFSNDASMAGTYLGYDGPCPPFNDARPHNYHFRLYALNTAHLKVPPAFDWAQMQWAMQGHVLDQLDIVGTYTLNPRLAP